LALIGRIVLSDFFGSWENSYSLGKRQGPNPCQPRTRLNAPSTHHFLFVILPPLLSATADFRLFVADEPLITAVAVVAIGGIVEVFEELRVRTQGRP
jgi:hypothetical protein